MKHSLKYLVIALTLTTATMASADGIDKMVHYPSPAQVPAGVSSNRMAFTDLVGNWEDKDIEAFGKIAAKNPNTTFGLNTDGLTRETADRIADKFQNAGFNGDLVLRGTIEDPDILLTLARSGAANIIIKQDFAEDLGKTLPAVGQAATSTHRTGIFTVDARSFDTSEEMPDFGPYNKANASVRVLTSSDVARRHASQAGYTVQAMDAKGNTIESMPA